MIHTGSYLYVLCVYAWIHIPLHIQCTQSSKKKKTILKNKRRRILVFIEWPMSVKPLLGVLDTFCNFSCQV